MGNLEFLRKSFDQGRNANVDGQADKAKTLQNGNSKAADQALNELDRVEGGQELDPLPGHPSFRLYDLRRKW